MIALLRSLSRPDDAIAALVRLLDSSPTDAEAWSELSELYLRQGLYGQAIFSLEEVLLITPFAWNVSATSRPVYAAPWMLTWSGRCTRAWASCCTWQHRRRSRAMPPAA